VKIVNKKNNLERFLRNSRSTSEIDVGKIRLGQFFIVIAVLQFIYSLLIFMYFNWIDEDFTKGMMLFVMLPVIVFAPFFETIIFYSRKTNKWRSILSFSFFLVAIVFFYSFAYFNFGIKSSESYITDLERYLDCLYFSCITFTTVGYGDISPIGASKIFSVCQAFSGYLYMALLIVKLQFLFENKYVKQR